MHFDWDDILKFARPLLSATVCGFCGMQVLRLKTTKTAYFDIDWDDGMTQEVILSGTTATTLTASFSNIRPYATYQFINKIGKDNMELEFNQSIFWPGGVRPTLSNVSGSRDVITFTTDGDSNMYGVAQFNFSASVG